MFIFLGLSFSYGAGLFLAAHEIQLSISFVDTKKIIHMFSSTHNNFGAKGEKQELTLKIKLAIPFPCLMENV